jgi:hypothetical protein
MAGVELAEHEDREKDRIGWQDRVIAIEDFYGGRGRAFRAGWG